MKERDIMIADRFLVEKSDLVLGLLVCDKSDKRFGNTANVDG